MDILSYNENIRNLVKMVNISNMQYIVFITTE